MIRAAIAHADVPVLGDDGQVGLARHHAPGSSGASDGRTTELLCARPTADRAPVKSLPAVPRQPTHGDEPTPVTGSAVPGGAGSSLRLPIDRLSVSAHRRVQRELQRVQDALDQPLPEIVAVDSSSRNAQLADHDRRRQALQERRSHLRALLDQVVPDSSLTGGAMVVPGCLVGVEDPDEPGIMTYEIAMLAGDEAERLSPDTPLGKALMWREAGDEVSWQTERGTRMRVIVRYIQD